MIRKNKAKLTHLNIRISLLQTVIFQMKGNFSSALEISEKKAKSYVVDRMLMSSEPVFSKL